MLGLFTLTVVLPGIVLLGFGLRALDQDRRATDQEVRERLQRADALAARAIDRQLANWQQFRSDGVSLETDPALKIVPPERVAYEFGERIAVQAIEPALAEAEHVEQVRGDIESAISLYRRATATGIPHLRAAAFERLAACYRKTGKPDSAVRAYRQLLKFPNERIGFLSAELIARFELCSLGAEDRIAFYHRRTAGGVPGRGARPACRDLGTGELPSQPDRQQITPPGAFGDHHPSGGWTPVCRPALKIPACSCKKRESCPRLSVGI